MNLVTDLSPEVIAKIKEAEERAQRVLIKLDNDLMREAIYKSAKATQGFIDGGRHDGPYCMEMLDFVLSTNVFKKQENMLDYFAVFYRYLYPHISTLIDGYKGLQMTLNMMAIDQDRLLKQLAEEVTERKLFLEFLKRQHFEDLYAKWKKEFAARENSSKTPD
jgi:hypothetical protein